MLRAVFLGVVLLLVAACDPMQNVPRFNAGMVDESAGSVGAFATGDLGDLVQQEAARRRAEKAVEAEQVLASLPSSLEIEPAPRRGLFSGPRKDRIPVQDVALGEALPFGEVGRDCSAPRRPGTKVAQFPESRPKYTIYDSDPEAQGQRLFYVTGFDDGCARSFSAALAMFGDIETYELIRFGPAAQSQPPSAATDKAYDRLKRRACGVSADNPCGAKLAKLHRDTIFVSVYERFGSNRRWTTLLLHQGAVEAIDVKQL